VRLLYVEDSLRLQRSVGTGLRRAGHALDLAGDGEEGLWFAASNDYDVVILDLMLPRLDGWTFLRRLREQGRTTHVLVLTARDAVEDRVRGLREGADDYLVKPFAFEELLARVEALARRRHGVKRPRILVGDLEIDLAARTAGRGGRSIPLTRREYALLEHLALRPGEVLSRSDIEAHLYDDRADPMSNVVDAAVCALRRKIDRPGEASLIQTRRGMGYVLAAPAP
jgi:DNA-binding response OmpR family regulator